MEQKRKQPRVRISRPVYVHASGGDVIRASAFDISLSGIGIICPQPFVQGDILNLRLHIGVTGALEEAILRGQVRYHYLKDNAYALGVEFIDAAQGTLSKIGEFVHFRQSLQEFSS